MGEGGYKIRDQLAIHFLTFTVVEWIDIFTRDIYRDIIIEGLKYGQSNKGLMVHAWVIMTNHLHLIVSVKEGFTLSNFIRDFKKYTSTSLLKAICANRQESRSSWMFSLFKSAGEDNSRNKYYQLWKQDNHPVELCTNRMMDQRLAYLHNNPVKAGFARRTEDYPYSSAYSYKYGDDDILDLVYLE